LAKFPWGFKEIPPKDPPSAGQGDFRDVRLADFTLALKSILLHNFRTYWVVDFNFYQTDYNQFLSSRK
jgi:hypothetical protein